VAASLFGTRERRILRRRSDQALAPRRRPLIRNALSFELTANPIRKAVLRLIVVVALRQLNEMGRNSRAACSLSFDGVCEPPHAQSIANPINTR
jgi:hypothetical protein